MWAGVIVLVVVAVVAAVAWWFVGGAPTASRPSRGGSGVQPGRDYNGY